MKKISLLLAFIAFSSCSVDPEENFEAYELNAVVDVNGCESQSVSFGSVGSIEVTNDQDYLYVSIVADAMYDLKHTKLHIVGSEDGFPTVGQGNLPPGKMDYKESFTPAVDYYTWKFPLSDYEGCIYIASQSEFVNGSDSATYWAGDIDGESGNWSYFEYCIQTCQTADPCEAVNAGSDNLKVMSYSEAAALGSWDEVHKLYLSLLDPGVVRTGIFDNSFDPSIPELIDDFNVRGVGDYTTEYTLAEGDCSDSTFLTIRVVPDE